MAITSIRSSYEMLGPYHKSEPGSLAYKSQLGNDRLARGTPNRADEVLSNIILDPHTSFVSFHGYIASSST